MSQLSETAIRDVVMEVLAKLQAGAAAPVVTGPGRAVPVFSKMPSSAAKAARTGFEQLKRKGFAGRAKVDGNRQNPVRQKCRTAGVRYRVR
jgi:hypothetical protein